MTVAASRAQPLRMLALSSICIRDLPITNSYPYISSVERESTLLVMPEHIIVCTDVWSKRTTSNIQQVALGAPAALHEEFQSYVETAGLSVPAARRYICALTRYHTNSRPTCNTHAC